MMINEFQEKCEKALNKRLQFFQVELTNREIKEVGKGWFKETTGEFVISGSVGNMKIWIYEDEAEVQKEGKTFHFEAPDFDSGDDLITAFTNKVIGLFQNVDDDNDGSAKRITFSR